ncbi:porin family protein [bacterium]|nr:porin family protein [bacterium]
MKMKAFCIAVACVLPTIASAAIPYRVQQVRTPMVTDDESFASEHRFYAGASYNFSIVSSYTDDANVHIDGKNTSSFDVVAGVRVTDIFRIEANYIRTRAKWDAFSLNGNAGFINAIVDARIDAMYQIFHTQHLVPYVGAGGGIVWNKADDADINKKSVPAMAALAGLAIEMGEMFTVDLGYRYMYMFSPDVDGISDLAPTSHQFRAGVRINF